MKTPREELADRLERVADALADLYGYWVAEDLEPDVLAEDEFPFDLALEDQLARVHGAVDRIREREEDDDA